MPKTGQKIIAINGIFRRPKPSPVFVYLRTACFDTYYSLSDIEYQCVAGLGHTNSIIPGLPFFEI